MKTDAELNALFAEHVAEWKWQTVYCGVDGTSCVRLVPPSGDLHANVRETEFTTDANAVLPWLEEHSAEIHHVHRANIGWHWEVDVYAGDSNFPTQGEADTFPRAAVIALLRAKGVKV